MTITVRVSAIFILFCAILIATYPVWAEDATSTGTSNRKDAIKERVETRKENLRQKFETRRENIRAKIESLREKLKTFRDQKKATAAARISENLNKINSKHTENLQKHLNRMKLILGKLEERVSKGTPDIKDADKAKAAIAEAKAKIASAEAAVKTQADNDYTVSISSEVAVRRDVKTVRDRLHTDLSAVRKIVIAAKQAVANAIRVAKSGKLEIPGKEATESGQ